MDDVKVIAARYTDRPKTDPAARVFTVADHIVVGEEKQRAGRMYVGDEFRAVVITLDFGANYLVLGEPATAAGLSAISLVGGPVFYLVHEVAWNRAHRSGLTVSAGRDPLVARAVVKTITYRTFATAMEFTTNYVVVGDVATAALLSAFGFIVGPFLYFGHEMAWGRLGPRAETAALGRAR